MDAKFQLRQESFCSLLNRVSSNDGSFQLLSLTDFLAFPRMTSDCPVRESYLRINRILRRWIRWGNSRSLQSRLLEQKDESLGKRMYELAGGTRRLWLRQIDAGASGRGLARRIRAQFQEEHRITYRDRIGCGSQECFTVIVKCWEDPEPARLTSQVEMIVGGITSSLYATQKKSRNTPKLLCSLAFGVWTFWLPQFDRISLRVMQASEPAVGIRLRVNLDLDSRSL